MALHVRQSGMNAPPDDAVIDWYFNHKDEKLPFNPRVERAVATIAARFGGDNLRKIGFAFAAMDGAESVAAVEALKKSIADPAQRARVGIGMLRSALPAGRPRLPFGITLLSTMLSRVHLLIIVVAVACSRPIPNRGEGLAKAPIAAPAPPRSPGQDAYDEGYRLGTAGDIPAALAEFRKATELDPNLGIAWFDLGGLSEQMGDIEGAVKAFEKCVAVLPSFAQARVELGTLYFLEQHKFEAAMAQLRIALTTADPFIDSRFPPAKTRGRALHNLAAIFGEQGFPAAVASMARSVLTDPDAEPDSRTNRYIQLAQRDLEEDASKNLVHEADSLRRSAQAQEAQGMFAAADQLLTRATEAAHKLPLDQWMNLKYAQLELRVRAARLDDAMRTFEDLAWIELITRYDPLRGPSRATDATTDAQLAPMRKHPDFDNTVRKYQVKTKRK